MQTKKERELAKELIQGSRYTIYLSIISVACLLITVVCLFDMRSGSIASKVDKSAVNPGAIPMGVWKAPDDNTIPPGKPGDIIRYGKELLTYTSKYLGPHGTVAQLTNGMNCQNCHLASGTRLFGNNYAGFMASYPKFSERSGKIETASERIADCFERSLAGKVPDTSGKEVQAILAYMKWVGKDVKKGQKLFGNGTGKLRFMDQAADPVKGKEIFILKCQVCHGSSGEGSLASDRNSYINPPLWGKHSYNDGAGMYRITNLAGFVKNNMPYGATYQSPQLTDEEAWNVAAFINSQPRPHRDQRNDWKDLKNKPIDLPFGPYADTFGKEQHKYGPYNPIMDGQKQLPAKKNYK